MHTDCELTAALGLVCKSTYQSALLVKAVVWPGAVHCNVYVVALHTCRRCSSMQLQYTAGIPLNVKSKAMHHLLVQSSRSRAFALARLCKVVCCLLCALVGNVRALAFLQAVLDEVAGRQVAVNNRAGRSSGQVEALLTHVDALLASNGNTLFTPSCQPTTVIQPARYCTQTGVHLIGKLA